MEHQDTPIPAAGAAPAEPPKSRPATVMGLIRALQPGESAEFPIEWMDSVRAQTTKCNAIHGGRRSTRLDPPARKIYVTRTE